MRLKGFSNATTPAFAANARNAGLLCARVQRRVKLHMSHDGRIDGYIQADPDVEVNAFESRRLIDHGDTRHLGALTLPSLIIPTTGPTRGTRLRSHLVPYEVGQLNAKHRIGDMHHLAVRQLLQLLHRKMEL